MFLVVCLQTQAFATVALSCAHSGPMGTVASSGCHQSSVSITHTSDTETPESAWIDCQSCHLGCVCGGVTLLMPNAFGIGAVPETVPMLMSQRHYYSFVPDFPQRPPISGLA